jgi:hypothetical protein
MSPNYKNKLEAVKVRLMEINGRFAKNRSKSDARFKELVEVLYERLVTSGLIEELLTDPPTPPTPKQERMVA